MYRAAKRRSNSRAGGGVGPRSGNAAMREVYRGAPGWPTACGRASRRGRLRRDGLLEKQPAQVGVDPKAQQRQHASGTRCALAITRSLHPLRRHALVREVLVTVGRWRQSTSAIASVARRLISSGMRRSPLRKLASRCATGISTGWSRSTSLCQRAWCSAHDNGVCLSSSTQLRLNSLPSLTQDTLPIGQKVRGVREIARQQIGEYARPAVNETNAVTKHLTCHGHPGGA
jgi:hypothetical protein